MNRSAFSVFCFGLYLVPVGVGLTLAPNPLLAPLGFPPSGEFWPHVVGILVVLLAFYYIQAARSGLAVFFQWTVYTRTVVFGSFGVLALLKWRRLRWRSSARSICAVRSGRSWPCARTRAAERNDSVAAAGNSLAPRVPERAQARWPTSD